MGKYVLRLPDWFWKKVGHPIYLLVSKSVSEILADGFENAQFRKLMRKKCDLPAASTIILTGKYIQLFAGRIPACRALAHDTRSISWAPFGC